jgi:drug/metabolite transporter (DMT)-like permease
VLRSAVRPETAPHPAAAPSAARIGAITLATLACFAANSLLCRAALAPARIDPVTFTAVRVVSGAAALTALGAARRTRPRGGSWGSALALIAYAAAFSLAYVRISAGVGALLLFAAVQATMTGWSVLHGIRPRARQWAVMAIALGGLAVLGAPGAQRPDALGAALMVAAGVAWGAYSVRGRGPDPIATNADNFVRALPFASALAIASAHPGAASPRGLALAAASGAIATGVGYSLWYAVLPHLGATRAAVVQLAVPVAAALGAVVLLGEPLTIRLVTSGAAVLFGISLAASRR